MYTLESQSIIIIMKGVSNMSKLRVPTPEEIAAATPEEKELYIKYVLETLQNDSQQAVKKVLDRINIPDDWDSLDEFAEWYRDAGYPILPPADTKIYVGDCSYSTIVFRKGRFQAEFYLVAPNSSTKLHTHNHASKFVVLAGSMEGYKTDPTDFVRVGKRYSPAGKDDVDPDFGIIGQTDYAGDLHGLRTLEHGVTFFNLEMWPEDIVPTSALVEYEGPSMGPEHEKIMIALKQATK